MLRRNTTKNAIIAQKSTRNYSTGFDNKKCGFIKIVRATQTFGSHEIKFVPSIKGFTVTRKSCDGEIISLERIVGDRSMEWKYMTALQAVSVDQNDIIEASVLQKLLIVRDNYEPDIADLPAVMGFIKRGILY